MIENIDEIETVEEVDEILNDLADNVERDRADLAAAIRTLIDETEVVDGEIPFDEEEVVFPFRDEGTGVTFGVGIFVGSLIETKERIVEE
jgi:hypothetical protein